MSLTPVEPLLQPCASGFCERHEMFAHEVGFHVADGEFHLAAEGASGAARHIEVASRPDAGFECIHTRDERTVLSQEIVMLNHRGARLIRKRRIGTHHRLFVLRCRPMWVAELPNEDRRPVRDIARGSTLEDVTWPPFHETMPELELESVPGARTHSSARPVLVVLTGAQIGERVCLDAGPIEVGRDPRAGLVIRDAGVGWRHARFAPSSDGWIVSALDPALGIEVNGMCVARTPLSPDDRIQIGSIVVRFELHGPAEQAFDAAVEERLSRDELTGLLSRRKFEIQLSGALDAAAQGGEKLGLAVIDLDGLKQINDRHGHLVGARMIAAAGRAIAALLSGGAFACRLGGDEFAVAMPGATIECAERFAGQLILAIADARIAHDGEALSVAASAGVAVSPAQGTAIFTLLRAADDALLRAKRDGRGVVRR